MSLDALTRTALLGTARQSPEPVALPAGLPASPSELAVERGLLRDAAVLAVYEAAGVVAQRVSRLPEPAPEETRPVCPPAAAGHLSAILGGPYGKALREWLEALAATGCVIPPEHARALVELGSRDAGTALALEPVLSARARWLAGQHGWAWAWPGDPAERWETGSRSDRLHLLHVLRRRGETAAGRQLVALTWGEDSARDREAIVGCLEIGLGLDDEPFLEAALDDRAQSVRARAAAVLSQLPDSALAQRMAGRLMPLIDTGRRKLTVELPDTELDAAMQRDAITDTPPDGVGRRAWILRQLVVAAPLRVWGEPSEVLKRRVGDGLGDMLRPAWAAAAIRQRDGAWAAALLERGMATVRWGARLAALLDRDAQEAFASPRDGRNWPGVPKMAWSCEFTAQVAAWIAKTDRAADWAQALGLYGDPALADRMPAGTSDRPSAAQLREAAALLEFRRTMLDTLKEARPE